MRFREVISAADNALLLATLALRAYQLDHQAYPETLAALMPKYLTAVPADPFADNAMLHYARTEHGYLLYSIGPDGKDDGGRSVDRGPTGRQSIKSGALGDVLPTQSKTQ